MLSKSLKFIEHQVIVAAPDSSAIVNMSNKQAIITSFARSFAFAIGIFLALFLLSPAHKVLAADIRVDSNCSLPDAIQAAESDAAIRGCAGGSGADTIHLTGDVTLAAELPQITSDITIEGGGYSINGNYEHRIFKISRGTLIIRQLTITRGYAVSGGAIFNDGALHLIDSNFTDNSATGGETKDGGGAIHNNGELIVTNCKFTKNSSNSDSLYDGYGGAILSNGDLTVSNSKFIDNIADRGGGAIHSDGALNITGSEFARNSAGGGGAIHHDTHETLSIRNSGFTGNAAGEGGAISNKASGWLVITDSTFAGNSAGGWGSAIINKHGELTVADSTFSGNSAGDGGSIYNSSTAEVTNSTFDSNAADAASAVFNGGSNLAEMTISNSVFTNNAAQQFSGAIMNGRGATLTINGSRFVGNTAVSGAAISNIGDELTINGSSFINNSALGMSGEVGEHFFERSLAKGAGGAILNLGPLSIADSSFLDNSAPGYGGAIFSVADFKATNSTLAGNSAEYGGGLYIYFLFPSSVTMTHMTIASNSADEGGGIAVEFEEYEDTVASLHNNVITSNDGGDCSAVISQSSGNLIEDDSCDAAISGDPKLGTLVEPEDGSPAYFPLLPGSPAIDAADPAHCTATDQTGAARPQGVACDIGAFEFQGE